MISKTSSGGAAIVRLSGPSGWSRRPISRSSVSAPLADKLQVWERGSDLVLAAHVTQVKCGTTTTLETVRFERPNRIDFRLVRGPVPHLVESFLLEAVEQGTEFRWQGELGTDGWQLGELWGRTVARAWTRAVDDSVAQIAAEAERRAARQSVVH